MSTGAGKIVCVTGASGYIASWLVKLLLSRGYTVKASVRDPNDPKKTQHLRALSGAQERLELFKEMARTRGRVLLKRGHLLWAAMINTWQLNGRQRGFYGG